MAQDYIDIQGRHYRCNDAHIWTLRKLILEATATDAADPAVAELHHFVQGWQ